MSTPYEFESWNSDVELGNGREFEDSEAEWEAEFRRPRGDRGWLHDQKSFAGARGDRDRLPDQASFPGARFGRCLSEVGGRRGGPARRARSTIR